jgi:AcrR family transcriptional regulator
MKPAKKSSDTKRHQPHLEREKVLDAALELLDEVGFHNLTVRKLAARLEVKAAALYWHFQNKQDLINEMAARIFTREFDTDKSGLEKATWRQILRGMSYGLCDALMRYRDGALVIATADLSKTAAFKGRELVVNALLQKGMPPEIIFTSLFIMIRYTMGYVFEEQTDPRAQQKGGAYQHIADELKRHHPDSTAELIRLHAEMSNNPRYQFEQGLELILDGIEKKITA